MWGPTPKIEAAQGLMDLAWSQGLDVTLRGLLTQLAADKSPAVRYQIASRSANFHAQDRKFYWKFVDGRLEAEKAPAMFSALIRSMVFPNVALAEPDQVVERLAHLLQQWLPSKKTKDIVLIEPSQTSAGQLAMAVWAMAHGFAALSLEGDVARIGLANAGSSAEELGRRLIFPGSSE